MRLSHGERSVGQAPSYMPGLPRCVRNDMVVRGRATYEETPYGVTTNRGGRIVRKGRGRMMIRPYEVANGRCRSFAT